MVAVRPAETRDADGWFALRDALWPGSHEDHAIEIEVYFADPPEDASCLVAEAAGRLVGFAEVGLRSYAEHCTSSPVGFLEGIYVSPEQRARGIGRALVGAGEAWARARGCTEMASDRELSNMPSGRFHESVGYEETARIVCYRKSLRP